MSEETDNRKPLAERRLAPVSLLGIWWKSMPEWVKEAFHSDPTINRVMTECSLAETTAHEMQWRVCAAMYEQRNQWRETAIHLRANAAHGAANEHAALVAVAETAKHNIEQHDIQAKAANFGQCGCLDCKAIRPLLAAIRAGSEVAK